MLKRSFTATVARDELWRGSAATEPYEAAWASEAIFFVRLLEASGPVGEARAAVQISPDGMHWVNEGTEFGFPQQPGEVTFGRVKHFGGYLRIAATLPEGAECRVLVALALKE
jgi:hypothetical protein